MENKAAKTTSKFKPGLSSLQQLSPASVFSPQNEDQFSKLAHAQSLSRENLLDAYFEDEAKKDSPSRRSYRRSASLNHDENSDEMKATGIFNIVVHEEGKGRDSLRSKKSLRDLVSEKDSRGNMKRQRTKKDGLGKSASPSGVGKAKKSFRFNFWSREHKEKHESSKKIDAKKAAEEDAKKSKLKSEIRERNKQLQKTKEQIHKMYERYYNKWRDYDLLTSILSILGLVVAIVDREFLLSSVPSKSDDPYPDNLVRVIISFTTLLAIFSITKRHYMKTQWLNYELPKELQNEVYSLKIFDNTWKRERKRNFLSQTLLWEVVMVSFHPLPYYDPQFTVYSINLNDRTQYVPTTYRLSHIMLVLMFIRVIFLIRTIFNYSQFTDLYSKRLCESYGFTANVRFTFKCLIIRDPGLTTFITITVSTFMLAYFLRIFEIEYYRQIGQIDFDSYFQAIWVIVVSITTVGFGDLVPYSYIGRVIIMIAAFWGAFLISLLIVTVSKTFELSRNQKKAMHHLFLTRKAATSITSAMRYYMAKKRSKLTQAQNQGRDTKSRGLSLFSPIGGAGGLRSSGATPGDINWTQDLEEELMISERVEAQDLKDYKNMMTNCLQEFKGEWNELKHLQLEADNQSEQMIYLIKSEVIDLADRFDIMQETLQRQSQMLEALLMSQQQQNLGANNGSMRLTRRLQDNDLLEDRASEDQDSENEESMENSAERSYMRQMPEDFTVEENEVSRSQMLRKANKVITKSELQTSRRVDRNLKLSQITSNTQKLNQAPVYLNTEQPHGSMENPIGSARQTRAISNLGIPQHDNFQALMTNGSETLSARMSIRKSPFYQKQKTKLQRSQARKNAITSPSPIARNDKTISNLVQNGTGALFR